MPSLTHESVVELLRWRLQRGQVLRVLDSDGQLFAALVVEVQPSRVHSDSMT